MPAGSNSKRERQYEHIKESAEDRGESSKPALGTSGTAVGAKHLITGVQHRRSALFGGSPEDPRSLVGVATVRRMPEFLTDEQAVIWTSCEDHSG